MKLHNTRTRKIEPFQPIDPKHVRIYSCGPTVYDHAHIGNLSAYIFADTLRRVLQAYAFHVTHAMNYTDVDDKTIRRSSERYADKAPEVALKTLTDQYIELFVNDMRQIGNDIDALTFLRATDEQVIHGMQELIRELHANGFAYIADDGVYFSIEAYRKSGKVYGQLLELNDANTSEARIQNDEYDKESIHDFSLWKIQKAGEPAWEFSLDGKQLDGRPGWHIECSVMSALALGQPFDIHTGGIDLVFPHHENEIAQSTAGKQDPIMARYFAHNEHLLVDGKKMAKSARNFYSLEDITKKGYDPLAFRLLILQAHYRSQAHFSWDNLSAAQNRLTNLRAAAYLQFQPAVSELTATTAAIDFEKHWQTLLEHLGNDLNTPLALASFQELLEQVSTTKLPASLLPAFHTYLQNADQVFGLGLSKLKDVSDEQKALIAAREQARQDQDWQKSDSVRDTLAKQGVSLRDTPEGAIWARQ